MSAKPRKKAPINKETDAKDVGSRIREARTQAGLSQSQLAKLCGMDQSRITQIEGGQYDPRLSTIRRIAEALDLPLPTLLPPK
jgi:transcriptional regulator with XRE-family HTH domain